MKNTQGFIDQAGKAVYSLVMQESQSNIMDVAIIGAGITGLSAAFYLQQQAAAKKKLSFVVFEASNKVGGKICTEKLETKFGTFVLEQGPDSFLIQKKAGIDLAKTLNLEDEFLETKSPRNIFVLKNKQMVQMPEGMMLMIPTRIWPFLTTSLISFRGKLRAALEIFIPRKKKNDDESVYQFVKRRFGSEILKYIAEPLLAGIYNAQIERQSINATFPQFVALEKKKTSLIRSMLFTKKSSKSPFVSFAQGMQTIIESLRSKLASSIALNTQLKSVIKQKGGFYELQFADGEKKYARNILLTTPAPVSAKTIKFASNEAATLLEKLRAVKSGCIYFGFKNEDLKNNLAGFGVIIPAGENRQINAMTWVSSKLANRAPHETKLLRIFFGGSKNSEIMKKSDQDIETIALGEVKEILGFTSDPLFAKIYRNNHDNPQYDVGHLELMEKIEQTLPENIYIAGSSYYGVGIPDCILQGTNAAKKITQSILRKSVTTL